MAVVPAAPHSGPNDRSAVDRGRQLYRWKTALATHRLNRQARRPKLSWPAPQTSAPARAVRLSRQVESTGPNPSPGSVLPLAHDANRELPGELQSAKLVGVRVFIDQIGIEQLETYRG